VVDLADGYPSGVYCMLNTRYRIVSYNDLQYPFLDDIRGQMAKIGVAVSEAKNDPPEHIF